MTTPSSRPYDTVHIGDFEVDPIGYGAIRLAGDGVWGESVWCSARTSKRSGMHGTCGFRQPRSMRSPARRVAERCRVDVSASASPQRGVSEAVMRGIARQTHGARQL